MNDRPVDCKPDLDLVEKETDSAPPNPSSEEAAGGEASAPNPAGIFRAGHLIDNRYEVQAHIGSGGMGEVYKVLDRSTQVVYALKMISPQLAEKKILAKRLEHEAQAARTLVHGNIVTVYDVGRADDGIPYLLMDYVEGDGLDAVLTKEVMLPAKRALPIFVQIAEALVHARQKSVVHRDLKPSNIILAKTEAGSDMVKIVDFGIAKIADQDKADKTKLTQTGELLGTPLYMSPEQCVGDEIDERSDIYSFGCIMYEVLTGKSPYAAENSVKVILKHLSDTPPPAPTGAGVSADLKQIIMRCLSKNKFDRYQNPVDLHIDLERVLDGRKINPHKRRGKYSKLILAGVCSTVLGCLLAVLVTKIPLLPTATPPPLATQEDRRPQTYEGMNLSQWTSAIEKNPKNPGLYYGRGYLHLLRDERTNAVDDFTQAIELNPTFTSAYSDRAYMYVMLAQYDKAAKDAEKLIALDPHSQVGYETRALMWNAREQYAEAIADWHHAIQLRGSGQGYFYYNLASEYLKLGKYQEAEKASQRAIELDNGAAYVNGIAGLVYCFQQQYTPAFTHLQQAVGASDGRSAEWSELAYAYVCTGKLPEAMDALNHVKELETFPARGFRLAGEVYRTAGQLDNAIQEFSKATSLEEYPPGYRERAVSYIALKQWRSAFEDLKKSHQLNPYSATTLSWLALVENHLGMKSEATKHMEEAFKAKELPPIVFVNRARIAFENGDLQKALADANEAINRDNWLKEGYEIRSLIEEKSGDVIASKRDAIHANQLTSHFDL